MPDIYMDLSVGLVMDWTNIITTLIVSGAFSTIYLLGDKKTAAILDNVSKTIDQWQELVGEMKGEISELREEFRKKTEDYEARLVIKDNKIDSLYKEISILRDRNDKLSSNVARLTVVRCWKISCGDRQPPMGTKVTTSEDINVIEQIKID